MKTELEILREFYAEAKAADSLSKTEREERQRFHRACDKARSAFEYLAAHPATPPQVVRGEGPGWKFGEQGQLLFSGGAVDMGGEGVAEMGEIVARITEHFAQTANLPHTHTPEALQDALALENMLADFRSDAVALAKLVLRTYNEFGYLKPNAPGGMIEEVSRLARKLTGEQE